MPTPYGHWKSPISAEMLAAGVLRLSEPHLSDGAIWWIEGRPSEQGRCVLVRDGRDVLPAPWNVRTRAHEYGGGAYTVAGGRVWFVHNADQRIYHAAPGAEPGPLTAPADARYADLTVDAVRRRLLAIREDHTPGGEPVTELIAIDLATGGITVLDTGRDFYASPALSPDGAQLAWLTWDHPNMPWDETALWLAAIAPDGSLENARTIAGGSGVSVFQPTWSPAGELWFAADPDGWWNLHRYDGSRAGCMLAREAEFAQPQWVFGMRTFGFAGDGAVVAACCRQGQWQLGRLDPRTRQWSALDLPLTDVEHVAVEGSTAAVLGGAPQQPASIFDYDLASGAGKVVRSAASTAGLDGYLSGPEAISFPTGSGATAHAFFYPPKNADHTAPAGELPPLIVMAHGGPTSATGTTLSLKTQYWTSRGFAVLDVNYRGSTGYGRAYRDMLLDNWGIADVEDCVHGAGFLASRGLADRNRLAIRGGSAGGYLALAALTFHDTFSAGASYFGISDLELLATDTHKFESRYLDRLVGPYPEAKEIYHARSPIHHADQLNCPVIFFQGLDDKVVPPNQAEMLVNALRGKGIEVVYQTYAGEDHGFRRADTIRHSLETELAFYLRVFAARK